MAPSHSINFRPTDPKEKKAAVLAVISFNDAHHVPYSKGKVSEYFSINERTARKWCAEAAAAATIPASQPAHQPDTTTPDPPEARGLKRSLSEAATAEVLSPSISPGSNKGLTPARKAAQGRKLQQRKTDVKSEFVTPSPSPTRQLVTATPRRVGASQQQQQQQRKKQRRLDDAAGSGRFGDGSSDEYVAV